MDEEGRKQDWPEGVSLWGSLKKVPANLMGTMSRREQSSPCFYLLGLGPGKRLSPGRSCFLQQRAASDGVAGRWPSATGIPRTWEKQVPQAQRGTRLPITTRNYNLLPCLVKLRPGRVLC